MPLPRRLLPLLALLPGCSPLSLANALTPRGDVEVRPDLRFGDGPRALLDLYAPAGLGPQAPLLVFFYGGRWRDGSRQDYPFVARPLAELGCLVAVPDYRLFPEVRWPAFAEDGARAVSWLLDGPGAGRPVFLMGHSAGAFIALALATDPRWLGEGRRRLRGAIGLAGPYDFQPDEPGDVATFAPAPGGRARAAPADPAALSGAPPLLLLHGLADETVSPERSRELAALARAAGVPVRLIEYPGVGHIGIIASLAAPLRGLGLAGAPVLADIRAFLDAPAPAPRA
ncbi:alpha/beta hydrolase [Roseomonas sp. OT10]|uniref:alpha/beta hydrolase n=1 Tax=Roseomonas cutis TaxID=2897332 RepID=UPI001E3996A8|nr:alpha/beta hydrolase [Roseomonas sp. OT10]UFN51125.1 alpha/beta hydrolase [Roseomonas sp. OT10]